MHHHDVQSVGVWPWRLAQSVSLAECRLGLAMFYHRLFGPVWLNLGCGWPAWLRGYGRVVHSAVASQRGGAASRTKSRWLSAGRGALLDVYCRAPRMGWIHAPCVQVFVNLGQRNGQWRGPPTPPSTANIANMGDSGQGVLRAVPHFSPWGGHGQDMLEIKILKKKIVGYTV